MGVKTLSFLGIVTSSVFVYLCINSKKVSLYASLNHTPQQIEKVSSPKAQATQLKADVEKKVVPSQEPEFVYMNKAGESLYANFSLADQNKYAERLKSLCAEGCIQDIHFSKSVKKFDEGAILLELVELSREKNVTNFSNKLSHKKVEIAGVVKTEDDLKQIEMQCQKLRDANYTVVNQVHLAPVVKTIVKKEVITNQAGKKVEQKAEEANHSEDNSTAKEIEKKSEKIAVKDAKSDTKKIEIKSKPHKTELPKKAKTYKKVTKKVDKQIVKPIKKIENVQVEDQLILPEESNGYDEANSRIDGLLLNNPIEFNENQITSQSRQILDQVADIIRALEYMNATVAIRSYTDNSLGGKMSKKISQKRADTIKNYLVIRGVDSKRIIAEGRGASELVAQPDSIVNNRIEIEIKEGR